MIHLAEIPRELLQAGRWYYGLGPTGCCALWTGSFFKGVYATSIYAVAAEYGNGKEEFSPLFELPELEEQQS